MRRITDEELFKIARDIIQERVITSNRLYAEFNGDEEKYLTVLKELFTVESLKPYMESLKEYVSTGGDNKYILWFGYLTDIPEDKTSFTKAHVVMGDDYLKLIDCLTSELLGQEVLH